MSFFCDYQLDSFDNGLSIICETFQDSTTISSKTSTAKGKPMNFRFKEESFGCPLDEDDDTDSCPAKTRSTWPTEIHPWWNPSNRYEKPPYTFATMIAHAILSSKTGRLILNDIYSWIAENYPFYKLQDKGWQNSIRHNLSHKKNWFTKTDRKPTKSHSGRGCYWMLHINTEKVFVDNLSHIGNHGRRMSNCELVIDSNSTSNSDSEDDAILNNEAQNIQISRRSGIKDKKTKSKITAPRIRNLSYNRSFVVSPPKTEPKSFVFRVNQRDNGRKNPPRPRPKPGKRRKQTNPDALGEDGNDSAVEIECNQPVKKNKFEVTPVQFNDVHYTNEPTVTYASDLIEDIFSDPVIMCNMESYPTPEQNLLYGLQEPGLQSEIRTIDVKTDSIAKQAHCPMTFDTNEFNNCNGHYYGMNDYTWTDPIFYEPTPPSAINSDYKDIFWIEDDCLPGDDFIQYGGCLPGDEFIQYDVYQ